VPFPLTAFPIERLCLLFVFSHKSALPSPLLSPFQAGIWSPLSRCGDVYSICYGIDPFFSLESFFPSCCSRWIFPRYESGEYLSALARSLLSLQGFRLKMNVPFYAPIMILTFSSSFPLHFPFEASQAIQPFLPLSSVLILSPLLHTVPPNFHPPVH